jgi:hypothetical protein
MAACCHSVKIHLYFCSPCDIKFKICGSLVLSLFCMGVYLGFSHRGKRTKVVGGSDRRLEKIA